jgi:hypothetical protein
MSERLEIDPEELEEHEGTSAPRRRLFPALFLTVAVIGVGYFSWWTYQHAKPPLVPSNVPVIHSDAGPVKEVPTNPGGMVVPGRDSALLNRDNNKAPKVEQLLPEPEQVMPRPVAVPKAPPPQAAVAMPSPAPADIGAPVPAPPTIAAAPPPAAPLAPTPSPTLPAIVAPVAAPPPPAIASAAPPPAVVAPSAPAQARASSGYRLQLGALRSEDAAKQEWLHLQKAQPDLLGKLGVSIVRADLGDKGVYYRIQAGPVSDAAEAAQSCATLKSRNVGCILVKP